MRSEAELVITEQGAAELVRGDRVVWESLEDHEFRERYRVELLGDEDVPSIVDYLIAIDKLSAREADNLTVCYEGPVETIDGEVVGEDEDDGDDDSAEEDED